MLRIASLLLLALSACLAPDAEDPPQSSLALPSVWSDLEGSRATLPARFWESFGDAGLNAAIEESLAQNRELQVSSARVLAAAAEARIAGAARAPNFSLDANARRQKQIFVGLPIPGDDVLESTSSVYGVALNIAWEVDFWGRLSAQARGAQHLLAASELDLAAARLSLAGQSAKAWFAWAEAREQHALAERAVNSWEESKQSVERRFVAGQASALEVRLTAANLAGARAQEAARAEQSERVQRQLEHLLGRVVRGEIASEASLPDLGPLPDCGLPGELIARRPDLAASQERLFAAHAAFAGARANLYPSLRLQGALGRTAAEAGDLFDPDFSIWSIAAGLAQPLFQGGKLRAGVDLANARVREALAGFESALLAALAEVEIALAGERNLARLEALAVAAHEEARAAERLARERYPVGQATLLEVLEAERTELQSAVQRLSIRRRRLEQRIDLFLALGGGLDGWQVP